MIKIDSTLIICPNENCNILLRVPINKGEVFIRCPACAIRFDYSPSLVPKSDFFGKTFSHSKIRLFEKCPKGYELKYIKEIEEDFSTIEQYLGSCIHTVLEWAHEKKSYSSIITLEELIEFYKDYWDSEDTDNIIVVKSGMSKRDYWEQGKNMLSSYYNRIFRKDKSTTLSLEQKFSISLGPSINYTGIIDRIARIKNRLLQVIDYKTGKRVPDPRNDIQLRSYALYTFSKWDENIKLCYEDLRGDRSLTSSLKRKEQEKIRTSLIESIHRILTEEKYEAEPSILCKWCGYNRVCDSVHYYSDQNSKPHFNTESDGTNTCPKCRGELEERSGKFGIFIGCENFPDCRYTRDNW